MLRVTLLPRSDLLADANSGAVALARLTVPGIQAITLLSAYRLLDSPDGTRVVLAAASRRRATCWNGSGRWAQLDAEEQAARGAVEPERLSSAEVVSYLRSLPSLWADAGPEGRQALATALFARTDVLGFERMECELTPDAVELGLGAALPATFEIGKETWVWSGREG